MDRRYEFKEGDRHVAVWEIKQFLHHHPQVVGRPQRGDLFDAETRLALVEFQKLARLRTTDGSLDEETYRAIGRAMSQGEREAAAFRDATLGVLLTGATRTVNSAAWPTETHNLLIRKALPGLSERELVQIERGSEMIDLKYRVPGTEKVGLPKTLLPSEAHKHAMRKENQSVADAIREAQAWVDAKGEEAKRLQRSHEQQGKRGLALTALIAYGNGAHTIMDSTSPAHRGRQEYRLPNVKTVKEAPQQGIIDRAAARISRVWANSAQYACEMLDHKANEAAPPTAEEERETVALLRNYFRNLFGDEFLRYATKGR